MIRTIATNAEMSAWLEENSSFEDARLLSWAPQPDAPSGRPPNRLVFELAYQIEGDYRADSRRVSRAFKIEARDVHSYHGPLQHLKDHRLENMECIESGEGSVAFQLDIPGLARVVCSGLRIEELPLIEDRVPPWLSEREFSATVAGRPMPVPLEWIEQLREQGQEAAWHIYGVGAESTDLVPADYTGWFLQQTAILNRPTRALDEEGVFIYGCRAEGPGFRIQLEDYGSPPDLWFAMKAIVGRFKGVVIHCGNCELSGSEWLELIRR